MYMSFWFTVSVQYQMEMMRNLRHVNVDHLHVGWYQSTYFGSFINRALLDSQFNYQHSIEESVVLIYGIWYFHQHFLNGQYMNFCSFSKMVCLSWDGNIYSTIMCTLLLIINFLDCTVLQCVSQMQYHLKLLDSNENMGMLFFQSPGFFVGFFPTLKDARQGV